MNILNKYLVKSIVEKKGRTFLLLISISLSVSLLIGTLGASKSMVNSIVDVYKSSFGDYNIGLASSNRENPFIKTSDIKANNFVKNSKTICAGGYLSNNDNKSVKIYGMDLEDFKSFNVMKLLGNDKLNELNNNEIIISKKTSDREGLKINDEVKVIVLGKKYSFKVAGISLNKGLFMQDNKESFIMIANKETVSDIYGIKDSFTQIFQKVDSKNLAQWVKDFNQNNKSNNITAFELNDNKSELSGVSMIKNAMFIILGIVLIIAIFLISSSFNLIIIERSSTIGTFLSQGATKLKVIRMLLKESVIYGIIGGFIGILLGIGFINILSYVGNPLRSIGAEVTVNYEIIHFMIGFVFSICLSVLSSMLPILKIRKLPVKEVILNTPSVNCKKSIVTFIIGTILIVISAILGFLANHGQNYLAIISIFCLIIGIIMIIPKLVDFIMYPIVKMFRGISGLLMVAANNVKTSKLLINNIRLIVISIIAMLIITTIRISVIEEVSGAYEAMSYNVSVEDKSEVPEFVNSKIKALGNVDKLFENIVITNAYVNDDENDKLVVEGVTPKEWKGWNTYIKYYNENEVFRKLETKKNSIVLSESRAKKNGLKEGDKIKITYNNNNVELTVIGLLNSRMYYGGDYNLVNIDTIKESLGVKYPNYYYIQSHSNSEDLKEMLAKDFKGIGVNVQTKNEMESTNREGMSQITDLLKIFSYITVVVGGFGVISNIMISFLQRKREVAVISVLGLTKRKRGSLVFVEGVFQAVIALVIGLLSVLGINIVLTDFLKYMNVNLVLKYPVGRILPTIIAVMLLIVFTSISAMIKSQKISIINEIKYE